MPMRKPSDCDSSRERSVRPSRIYQTTSRLPWIRHISCLITVTVFLAGACFACSKVSANDVSDLSARVEGHLQAGEFGAALDLAMSASTEEEKALLAQTITAAQAGAGEKGAVERTIRKVPAGAIRNRARQAARERPMAGGVSFANPGPLMAMIEQLTGGPPDSPWLNADGEGGALSFEQNGVWVDPNGVLARRLTTDTNGRLTELGVKSRQAALNQDMATPSNLRFVSLARLEKAVAARKAEGMPILETMRHLAGLSRIQFIVAVPEENDILLAGPAEGWKYNDKGVSVGAVNGNPSLYLDDLVTVLRTFTKTGEKIFGCSINPRQEGLKAVKEYVEASQKTGSLTPGQTKVFLSEIHNRMGQQDVEIYGVPANSRVAGILVTADYRMKLIGIGKVEGGQQIPSIFELLPKFTKHEPLPLDALRWWLTMKYDAIVHSPDRMVYEIRGSSVKVMSEDQLVNPDGTRVQTGKASPVNQMFADNFTKHYSELAKRDTVFAELQNVFDLGMVAALIQSEHLAQRAKWSAGSFGVDGSYRPTVVPSPKTVESVINHRVYRGTDIVVQVAGGVRADVLTMARQSELHSETKVLTQIEQRAKVKLPAGRWWWDASE